MNYQLSFDQYWIYVYILGAVLIILLVFLFIRNKIHQRKKKKETSIKNDYYLDIIEAVGKIENIKSTFANGSRLSLVLNDYSLIDQDKLKSIGITGIIISSNKLLLLVGNNASLYSESISKTINTH